MRKIAMKALLGASLGFAGTANAAVQWTVESGGNGHYYDFVLATNPTWGEANAAASSLTFNGIAGHLATFTTRSEQEFVISALGGGTALNSMWLGGYQVVSGEEANIYDGWQWITGETWTGVSPSDPTKPRSDYGFNNLYFDGSTENYTITWWNTGGINDYIGTPSLNYSDTNGGPARGYLVEYSLDAVPSVPEPSTWAMMLVGFAGIGFAMRRKARSTKEGALAGLAA